MGQEVNLNYIKMFDDGEYLPDTNAININQDLSQEEKELTLLHEELHVLWDVVGLSHTCISEDLEHIIIESICNHIRQNYRLVRK